MSRPYMILSAMTLLPAAAQAHPGPHDGGDGLAHVLGSVFHVAVIAVVLTAGIFAVRRVAQAVKVRK